MDDPYQILGVTRDATADDIRRAYRKLAKRHHPDLNPGDTKAEARFKGVTAANDLLSDPARRARFDRGEIDAAGQEQAPRSSWRDHADSGAGRRYSAGAGDPPDWDADEFSDMFSTMFGQGRGRAAESPRRGGDERYALTTAFLDALNGGTQRVTLPDGRALNARIPPGTTEGQVLRLRGQGRAGVKGGPSGDLLLEIHVAPHPLFTRDGQDIRMVLPVSLSEAVLGGSVDAPTPAGPVRVRVPPGSDSGSELRLRGRGVPRSAGHPAGDLYATLQVRIGPPDPDLKAFLEGRTPEHPTHTPEATEPPP